MSDPFKRATVRAIRRTANAEGWLTPPGGERLSDPVRGVYDDPDTRVEFKSIHTRRDIPQRTFLMVEDHCPTVAKGWRLDIGDDAYHISRAPRDGSGGVTLHLTPWSANRADVGGDHGSGWR